MGNQQSAAHATLRPRKNVHWKTAGRPAAPGKPDIVPLPADDEPNAVTLRWPAPAHDGGAPLQGYQVECNRLGSAEWVRTAPPLVAKPELVLTGLEPPHRYQFRVAAVNGVGRSDYSELSDVLTVSADRAAAAAPLFLQHLRDVTALENDQIEFRVSFTGAPAPTVAWFKDDYEIFSSRRTAITTTDRSSVLLFHQTLAGDEGEIKCTATNRAGHAVSKARLYVEAAPKLRYPRRYEDGLLYEISETIFLKTTVVGKPTPLVEWRHDGRPIINDERVEITTTGDQSALKIRAARRSDRGEYQVLARNDIGEDAAAFLVTVTAPPDPPRKVAVLRQVDKSVTLHWEPPEDDGGCRVGNYVIEYYRTGWNVWLKATTSRETSVTLFDLIEGGEYRFRVKAESPYGMSQPSADSAPVRIPGRAADAEFLAAEARIISEELTRREGEVPTPATLAPAPAPRRRAASPAAPAQQQNTDEFMLVLYPENDTKTTTKTERRKSSGVELELEDALSPPVLSFSAPDLAAPGPTILRRAASSSELLHERAMARFYRAVELEQSRAAAPRQPSPQPPRLSRPQQPPPIYIKTDSLENDEYEYESRQASQDSEVSTKWTTSFDEDYTASTVSTDGELTEDEGSGGSAGAAEEPLDTYHPPARSPSPPPILRPLPAVDPDFVPKPILKRREPDVPESKTPRDNGVVKTEQVPKIEEKPKKEEKITLFKKLTKMPVQKPFPFPKILKRVEPDKTEQEEEIDLKPKISNNNSVAKTAKENKISDEGRTVIDYYGNIVKEYGKNKKPATQLYLNTDELKTVAEKQQQEKADNVTEGKKIVKQRKTVTNKRAPGQPAPAKSKTTNSIERPPAKRQNKPTNKTLTDKEKKSNNPEEEQGVRPGLLVGWSTERAVIDYREMEERAKENVRSAIDYAVDMCLLAVAFWVYLFRDERLCVPLVALAVYRQLAAWARSWPRRLRRLAPPALPLPAWLTAATRNTND